MFLLCQLEVYDVSRYHKRYENHEVIDSHECLPLSCHISDFDGGEER